MRNNFYYTKDFSLDPTEKYRNYILQHCENVKNGWQWIVENLGLDFLNTYQVCYADMYEAIWDHDKSKYQAEEFLPYANYFYGDKSIEVQQKFNYAWLHHQKVNPHHWQYWVLVNDEDGTIALDMPNKYIFEMIADWWAFSWSKNNLYEIFTWYKEHKAKMILSKNTQKTIENILKSIKSKLDEQKEHN